MANPKLLLADDSVTIRKVVELTFADEGLEVTTSANGEEAMQKFAENRPDIVIADVNMPEPTGYKICETIKQNEATKHIPVLLVVGSFEPFDQTEAERVGADGFLTKPFQSIRDLIIRVDQLLGRDNRAKPTAETTDIDALYEQSLEGPADVPEEEELEAASIPEISPPSAVGEVAETPLGDAGMDDEIIEMSHPSTDVASEPPRAAPVADPASSDNGAAAKSVGSMQSEAAVRHDADAENVLEPSDALVDMVARRVVEKLSDKIIRDVAKEAVPRIAEKLIREALEQDQKRK